MDLKERIREAINITSAENGSNTPDFILAEYLTDCLAAFDKAVKTRQTWYTPDKNHCVPGTHEKTKENTTSATSLMSPLDDDSPSLYYKPGDEVPGLGIVDELPFGLPWVSTKEGLYRYGVISVAQTHLCDAVSGKILTPEELESRLNNRNFDYGHRVQNSIVYRGGFQI